MGSVGLLGARDGRPEPFGKNSLKFGHALPWVSDHEMNRPGPDQKVSMRALMSQEARRPSLDLNPDPEAEGREHALDIRLAP